MSNPTVSRLQDASQSGSWLSYNFDVSNPDSPVPCATGFSLRVVKFVPFLPENEIFYTFDMRAVAVSVVIFLYFTGDAGEFCDSRFSFFVQVLSNYVARPQVKAAIDRLHGAKHPGANV